MPAIDNPGQHSGFDLSIGYRREGGDATALFLRKKLMHRGLRVFLDFVELHRGYFDEALLTCTANAPDFPVILSPVARINGVKSQSVPPIPCGKFLPLDTAQGRKLVLHGPTGRKAREPRPFRGRRSGGTGRVT